VLRANAKGAAQHAIAKGRRAASPELPAFQERRDGATGKRHEVLRANAKGAAQQARSYRARLPLSQNEDMAPTTTVTTASTNRLGWVVGTFGSCMDP